MTSATAWVESVTGRTVVEITPLIGGMSSQIERCLLEDGSSIVVRAITDQAWLRREPDLITNEAHALELVAASTIRAPHLIAADSDEARLAMSFLEGSMTVDPAELEERAVTIAAAAAAIATTPLPADHRLPRWRSWAPPNPEPPSWGDRTLWQRGIDALHDSRQPAPHQPVLLHRDLHPLNMLWSGPDEVGIVDWVNACVGHPHAELGHLRWNLTVLAGRELADRVLESYLALTATFDPSGYDRWWDIVPLMSFIGGPIALTGYHSVGRTDLTSALVVQRTEEFLETALSQR